MKILLVFSFIISYSLVFSQHQIKGKWLNESKTQIVEIAEVNGVFFGKLVWMQDSLDTYGEYKRDVMNGNAKWRSRKLLGIKVLDKFKWDGNKWDGGEIYNPESGSTYNSVIRLSDNGTLLVKGYWWFLGFLGKTKEWIRVK